MVINIATSLDDNFARYTYVMMLSALENRKDDDEYHFYILHAGLKESNISLLLSLQNQYTDCKIIPIMVDKSKFGNKLPTCSKWTIAMYYRLMLVELIPEDVDRIIYLDGDIIVNKSLSELAIIPFDENKLIMACEDYMGTESQLEVNYVCRVIFEKGLKYVNSGFLMIDMNLLRSRYSFDYYMQEAMKLVDMAVLDCPDQDILNYVHMDDIQLLDNAKYNLFAKQAYARGIMYEDIKRDVTIVHYASQKPWHGQYMHTNTEQIWWEYAKKTPFYVDLVDEFMKACLSDSYVIDQNLSLMVENKKLKEINDLQKQVIDKLMNANNM